MASTRPIVLITGANQGIGFETAKQIAKANTHTVLLTSRSEAKGTEARQKIIDSIGADPNHIHSIQLDIQDDASILAAAKHIEETFGVLDILINNAGKTAWGTDDISKNRAIWRDLLDLNVISHALVTDTFSPLLKKSSYPKRRVIFISTSLSSIYYNNKTYKEGEQVSVFNFKVAPYTIYKTSKTALNMLAQTYHMGDLGDAGVAVVVACPGWAKTAFNGHVGNMEPEDSGKAVFNRLDGDNADVDGKFFLPEGTLCEW